MQDDVRRPFQKGFVVGDIQHRERTAAEEILQPAQGGDVEIVGRFIEKEDVGPLRQQTGQTDFDPLAARKRPHRPSAVKPGRIQPQLPHDGASVHVQPREEGAQGLGDLLRRHFLPQIAKPGSVGLHPPLRLAVGLHLLRRGEITQQGALAVALFPDERRTVARAQYKAEIPQQDAAVPAQGQGDVLQF